MKTKSGKIIFRFLEGQRKTIDWWFSYLAVITAVLAVFGALILLLMGRKDKESIGEDKKQIEATKKQIETYKEEVARLKESIEGHPKTAATTVRDITAAHEQVKGFKSAEQVKADEAQKTQEAVRTIEQDPTADPSLGLRALAVKASQDGQAKKAANLWSALTELQPEDDLAHFNAGYWAQEVARQSEGPESAFWLRQAGTKYGLALELKRDDHAAAYNWGNALAAEARAVAGQDLAEARRLWQQAGRKYELALELKPDYHRAANRWGNILLSEAGALSPEENEQISLLLNRAEQILLAHVSDAPGVVAYNLACVWARRGDVGRCLEWLRTSETHHTLPDCQHLKTDHDLDAVRTAAEFVTWLDSVCPEKTDV